MYFNFIEILFGKETIQVQKPNNTFEFKKDITLSVDCKVANDEDLGNPKGTVQWFNGSSDVAIENVTFGARLASLGFLGLRKEDNESYVCRIENEVGRQEESIQLVVLGEVSYV